MCDFDFNLWYLVLEMGNSLVFLAQLTSIAVNLLFQAGDLF